MMKNYSLEIPKPIKGHHFSDYLACPTKAWYEFYGEEKTKAPIELIS